MDETYAIGEYDGSKRGRFILTNSGDEYNVYAVIGHYHETMAQTIVPWNELIVGGGTYSAGEKKPGGSLWIGIARRNT